MRTFSYDDLQSIRNIRDNESDYVSLAREALEVYIKEHRKITIPEWIPFKMSDYQAGVFVTLKEGGQLRGCIGTIAPTQRNVAEEIIFNAIQSGTHDPRFEPVHASDLDNLVYSVDVLSKPQRIHIIEELDVQKYGIIVSKGYRRGLLLPNIEGVNSPEEQIEIALCKAGISVNENYDMERFEVVRYH